jgi:hypothetical protein
VTEFAATTENQSSNTLLISMSGDECRRNQHFLVSAKTTWPRRLASPSRKYKKYRYGTNRISASNPNLLSKVLGVPVAGSSEELGGTSGNNSIAAKTEILKLTRYFFAYPTKIKKHQATPIKAAAKTL